MFAETAVRLTGAESREHDGTQISAQPGQSPHRLPEIAEQASPPRRRSEVRLISARNVGVAAVVIILMGVFSTDNLWPRAGPRYVSKRRGPRRREGPLILDRQLQLQELATMAAENIARKQQFCFMFRSIASFTSS